MDELHAGLASLKTAFDLTKTILDIQGTVKVQGKVFELQREILAAQQSALAANEAQMALVREKRRLEEQIAQLEAWNSENERYALSEGRTRRFRLRAEAGGPSLRATPSAVRKMLPTSEEILPSEDSTT